MLGLCRTGAGASAGSSFAAFPRGRSLQITLTQFSSGTQNSRRETSKHLAPCSAQEMLFLKQVSSFPVLYQLRKDKGIRHTEIKLCGSGDTPFTAELASNCGRDLMDGPRAQVPGDRPWGLQQTTHPTGSEKNHKAQPLFTFQ